MELTYVTPVLLSIIIMTNFINCFKPVPYFSKSNHSHNLAATMPPRGPYKELKSIYEARNIDFAFPSEYERNTALQLGLYVPDQPLPIDVDIYYSPGKEEPQIFITIPRFGKGIPYSLAVLTKLTESKESQVQAYPDYWWHSSHGSDCNGITSVYRVQIDECGHIWVLDSGEIDLIQYCPPSLAVFDLKTNELIHRYFLPHEMYKTNISRFVTPLVDIADPPPYGNCDMGFVYMADALGLGIVVYDVSNELSWRIENKFTYPDPAFSTFRIEHEHFELLDGVFALTVTPKDLVKRRMLYFHSLAGDLLIALPLDIANNVHNWGHGIASALGDFSVVGRRGTQCAASAMTEHGTWLCGYIEPLGLFGWDIRTNFNYNQIILADNPKTLQFISGLKVIKNPQGKEEVWMLSNRLQKAFTGTTNFNEINYRIQRCDFDRLLNNNPCL